jgi:hypothetical protein
LKVIQFLAAAISTGSDYREFKRAWRDLDCAEELETYITANPGFYRTLRHDWGVMQVEAACRGHSVSAETFLRGAVEEARRRGQIEDDKLQADRKRRESY